MAFTQVTRATLRADIKLKLGPTDFWRDDELNRLINESLHVWNLLTGYWRLRDTVTTVAGDHFYSVPSTILSLLRVEFNQKPVGKTSIFALDYGQPNWEAEITTDGGNVPSKVDQWAPVGLTLFAIWPGDAAGVNALTVDGIKPAPVLANDADFIDIGEEELNHFEDYVQHIAVLKSAGEEFEATMKIFEDFLKGAGERNALLLGSAKFRKWMGLDKGREQQPMRAEVKLGAR